MLRAILNKSWKQYPTKQQMYDHLLPISKTIHIRRTRHVGHCWRKKDILISDVLQWTPSHERASVDRPTRTYLQQLCTDTGCSLEDQPEAIRHTYILFVYKYTYICIYIYVCECVERGNGSGKEKVICIYIHNITHRFDWV